VEETGMEFVGGDGMDAIAEGFEGREGGGIMRLRERRSERGNGCGGGGVKETAAGEGSHGVREWNEEREK